MSDIDNTIERVKEEIDFAAKGNLEPLYCEHLIDDTVTLITAYEQSQKELKNERELRQSQKQLLVFRIRECAALEKMIDNLRGWPKQRSDIKAELETANKRIAELLAVLTTEEVDYSTLVETLNSARKIILRLEPEYCYELTEELCVWAEKLTKHKGE